MGGMLDFFAAIIFLPASLMMDAWRFGSFMVGAVGLAVGGFYLFLMTIIGSILWHGLNHFGVRAHTDKARVIERRFEEDVISTQIKSLLGQMVPVHEVEKSFFLGVELSDGRKGEVKVEEGVWNNVGFGSYISAYVSNGRWTGSPSIFSARLEKA
jgi:hypothetical protein